MAQKIWITLMLMFFVSGLPGNTVASTDTNRAEEAYSPYVHNTIPRQVYWGDTHVHSSVSADAGMAGNLRLGPADAYRFAMGETVEAHNGTQARLVRPLDFLVVADHAEYLGLITNLASGEQALLRHPQGKRWHKLFRQGRTGQYTVFQEFTEDLGRNAPRLPYAGLMQTTWDRMIRTADAHNQPGHFTTLIGYEWTSTPGGNNLHRVVLFRDGAERVKEVSPFSSFDSPDPEKLWNYMADYEARTGGRVMAIPHNANLSNGLMYDTRRLNGQPLTAAYARLRSRFEPLHEITQIKGDSETHPLASPADEFAKFERMDKANLLSTAAMLTPMIDGSYARPALRRGAALHRQLGHNPFKQGFIGSTDSHTSLATAGEDNFFGKAVISEPGPERWAHFLIQGETPELSTYIKETSASGLAAVWAHENTRPAIFDAMARRETYATTGPRISLRLFGGFHFSKDDLQRPDLAAHGYAKGVPMGGDLQPPGADRAPGFLVRAQRDPVGANLDRIQMIKGWVDSTGTTHEQIYNIALSGNRRVGPDGKVAPVGTTVDLDAATYRNSIGAAHLEAFWQDPDFDPDQHAFYYVRVLQIPTPRWTTYDAQHFNTQTPKNMPKTLQERAYSSPIWYAP